MKFPYSMLLDFVKTSLTPEQAGDLLTMAGFELEGIEEVNGEPVLDIKVMSNRGDGLSVFGLAREVLAKDDNAQPTELYVAASNRFSLTSPETGATTPVEIDAPDCTRYACRIFTNVQQKSSPSWMQDRLIKAGMRPISLIVDLTNYLMLELGQPMHAFDFDKLNGGQIIVRKAKMGEKITTLDGEQRKLTPEMMVIADADRAVAVAGVMGGLETEVTASTMTMLLESAHFVNTSVRRTRRALGMSTEASYRFERSVDPDGVVGAIERFSQLLVECSGGQPAKGIIDVYPSPVHRMPIHLRLNRANLLLGMQISREEAERHLTRMGFSLKPTGDRTYQVTPPTWRPDVVREEDVIEELGRVQGFDRIPEKLPHGSTTLGGTRGYEAWEDLIREASLRLGFSQTISHTLRSASPLDDPALEKIGPREISDPEMMWLRNSTLSSLADASRRNGSKDVHIFEVGQVFGRHAGKIVEKTALGFLSHGPLQGEWWLAKAGQTANFFTLKGVIETLARRTITAIQLRTPSHPDPRLHPTRQAEIFAPSGLIGIAGQIDGDTAEQAGLPPDTVLAELDLSKAYEAARQEVHVRQISRNPAVRRDLAFLIEKSVPFESIRRAVIGASGDLLEDHWLFDVYEGKGVPEGSHSLAIALQLRKLGANLTDDEANQVRERVVQALAQLGAMPR